MKNIRMARRLTFTYFAIVSAVIIFIHFSVYYSTFEGIERSLAKDRFDEVRPHAAELVATGLHDKVQVSPHIVAYTTPEALPDYFSPPRGIQSDQAYEVHFSKGEVPEFFYLKTQMMVAGKQQQVWLINFKDVHEFDREELFLSLRFQFLMSLILLGMSLLVVQKISSLLTDPLYNLANQIRQRPADDHSELENPEGIITQELQVLIDSFNQHQQTISHLIERERAFNRHASHELRTPLMVIKGALSLLKASGGDQFAQKQYQRLHQASEEMNEFISTLLTLSRDEDEHHGSYTLEENQIRQIIQLHEHLLEDKKLSWTLTLSDNCQTELSPGVLKILVGNLVKNAFSYTEEGEVIIDVNPQRIRITDTGIGLEQAREHSQGFGLGLVIVRDICRKYRLEFALQDNHPKGCIAEIRLG